MGFPSDTGDGGRLSIIGRAARPDADIRFVSTSTASNNYYTWNVGIDKSDGGKFKISSSTNALGTNDRFVIDGAGRVGIGTSSPTQLLDVTGNSSPALAVYDSSAAAAGKGGKILLQHTNGSAQRVNYATMAAYAVDGTTGAEDGDLVFSTMRNGTSTEGLRLYYTGNTVLGYGGGYEGRISSGAYSAGGGGFYPFTTSIGANDTMIKYAAGGNNFVIQHGTDKVLSIDTGSRTTVASTANVNDNLFINTGQIKGQLQINQTSSTAGAYSRITFGFPNYLGDYGAAAIGVRGTGSGSYMHIGTSNNYGLGVTNNAIVINPDGYIGLNKVPGAYNLDVNGSLNVGGKIIALGGVDRILDTVSASYTAIRPQNNTLIVYNSGTDQSLSVYDSSGGKAIALTSNATNALITAPGTSKLSITADTYPTSNATYTLGTPSLRWKNLYVSGGLYASGTSMFNVGNPTNDLSAINRGYVLSRGMNLVTNGSGLMGSNYNFSGFTYSQNEVHGGLGSFMASGTYAGIGSLFSDELIPVDVSKYYRMVGWAKHGDTGGAGYDPTNAQYAGVVAFDIDGNPVTPDNSVKYGTSTDTTLTQALNIGDTVMHLANAAGWNETNCLYYSCAFSWWPYTNSKGYTYPNYTYTRNGSMYTYGYPNPTWPSGGITGNDITLTGPWPGPALPSGTPVRNLYSGSTYKYIIASYSNVPNDWKRFEGFIGTTAQGSDQDANKFFAGTAYIKLMFLPNYNGTGKIRWSDLWLSELSSKNLEPADATWPGVVSTSTQTFGGSKTFSNNVYVSGNLGIGLTSVSVQHQQKTASRSTAFDAGNGATWHDFVIQNPNNTANAAAGIAFEVNTTYHTNAGTGIAAVKTTSDADYGMDLAFITRQAATTASEKMRILSTGGVGIGISPAVGSKLHVYTTGANNEILSEGSGGADYTEAIFRAKATNAGRGAGYFTTINGSINWFAGNPYSDTDKFMIARNTGAFDRSTAQTANSFFIIDNTGDVGIGQTAPGAKLQIDKSSTYNSEGTAGLKIDDSTAAVGAVMGADVANNNFYIQSLDPGTSYATRPLVLNPNAGNVGIGTIAPGTTLEVMKANQDLTPNVSGDAQVHIAAMTNDAFAIDKGGAIGMGGKYSSGGGSALFAAIAGRKANATDGLTSGYMSFLTTNASSPYGLKEWMRLDSGGNLGIGTTAPKNILDITKIGTTMGAVADSGLHIGQGTQNNYNQIAFGMAGTYVPAAIGSFTTAGASFTTADLFFATRALSSDTAPLERMRITSAGNVGIGTNSPSAFKLQVAGNVGPSSTSAYDLGSSSYYWRKIFVNNVSSTNIDATNIFLGGTSISGLYHKQGGNAFNTTSTIGTTDAKNLTLITNNTSRLTISSAGNVGIGTYTPISALNVAGTTALNWTTGSGLVTVGTVGTGGSLWVNTPGYNVANPSGFGITGTFSYPRQKATINLNAYGTNSGGYSADLAFSVTNASTLSEVMRITGASNVGIGTTSPLFKLQVAGNVGPSSTNSYDLGSTTYKWNHLYARYASNTAIDASDYVSSTKIIAGKGSVSAPSFTFRGDTDTGIYNANSSINFITNGTEPAFVWSGGVFINAASGHGGDLGLQDVVNGYELHIQATSTMAAGYNLVLPPNIGSNGQVLQLDANQNLTWGSVATFSGLTANHIPYFNGAALVNSKLNYSASAVYPDTNNSYDLGTKANSFQTIYASTSIIGGNMSSGAPRIQFGYLANSSGGYGSTAIGYVATASGLSSMALGQSVTASGYTATAMGFGSTASGDYSTALGNRITAQGNYSFGIGLDNTVGRVITQASTMAIMGGNVGIGTLAPGALFTVGSDALRAGSLAPVRTDQQTITTSSYTATDVSIDGSITAIAYNDGGTGSAVSFFRLDQGVQTSIATLNIGTGGVRSIKLVGNTLYVNSGSTLYLYDITDIGSPALIGSVQYDLTVNNSWMDVSGRYAYVGSTNDGKFYIIDISNKTAPYLVNTITETGIIGIKAVGPYLYLTESGVGMTVYNVTDPMNLVQLGQPGTATIAASDVDGKVLYYVSTAGNLYASDLSDYGSMTQFASVAMGHAVGASAKLIARNGLIYMLEYNNYLSIWKLNKASSNFTKIYELSDATSFGSGQAMDIQGNTLVTFAGNTNRLLSTYELNGTKVESFTAGSTEISKLTVVNNSNLVGDLNVGGSALFGGSAQVNNMLTVTGLTQLRKLMVDGNVTVRKLATTATESWDANGTQSTGVPTARDGHTAIWTGSNMLVWGGRTGVGTYVKTGGRYDPVLNTWSDTTQTGAPLARAFHTSVWTGAKMIVWGGVNNSGTTSTGGIYDPKTDSWKSMTMTNAPQKRYAHNAVWTGSKMFVHGGYQINGAGTTTGGIYDPVADKWQVSISTPIMANSPQPCINTAYAWTGSKYLEWGGWNTTLGNYCDGYIYNPSSNSWSNMSTTNAPSGRYFPTGVWTGNRFIVWGGYQAGNIPVNTGGVYDADTDNWSSITTTGAPSARLAHTAVWTGTNMIVWGGTSTLALVNTGASYNPINNSWTTMTTTNAPTARSFHTSVWTGAKMISWGGWSGTGWLNTGGLYNPVNYYQGNLMVEGDGFFNGAVSIVGAARAGGFYSLGGADFAEYMPHENAGLSAGDVIMLSTSTSGYVTKSASIARDRLVGVITDSPAMVGNAKTAYQNDPDHYALVSMLGQVNVKFSPALGEVKAGDWLMPSDDGFAVKAKGAGMVLGRALQDANATSSVLTYVKPMFWAGDTLASDGSITVVKNDIAMQAKGIATVSQQGYDSQAFSFNGSGWNSAASSSITTGFSLFNHTINASSSEFIIGFSTGTNPAVSKFRVTNNGDAYVGGDLTIGKRLYLGSKMKGQGSTTTYIYVDDTQAPTSTYIATNADGWQTQSTYDYAERYDSSDTLQPGDLVTVDPVGINKVKRVSSFNEPILGIVSTKPGFVTGAYAKGNFPIALAGRVPTRVSSENGAIRVGDSLTVSAMSPGVAVKAISAGNVVGIALESYENPGEGLISVFVKPGYWAGSLAQTGQPASVTSPSTTSGSTPATTQPTTADIQGLAMIKAGMFSVHVSYGSLLAYPMAMATPDGQVDGAWWIDNRTATGFDIKFSVAQPRDVEFTWTVKPMTANTIRFMSDNTYHPVDYLTGQMIGPMQPSEPVVTSTTTAPMTPVTAPTSTTTTSTLTETTTTTTTP
ncbi:MAG: Kelch repeat-containing protein [Patescibacteria group bacterium]